MSKSISNIGTITIDLSDEDCCNILDGETLGVWCFPIFDKNDKQVAEVNVNVIPENLELLEIDEEE